jgi:hypothetical protein
MAVMVVVIGKKEHFSRDAGGGESLETTSHVETFAIQTFGAAPIVVRGGCG